MVYEPADVSPLPPSHRRSFAEATMPNWLLAQAQMPPPPAYDGLHVCTWATAKDQHRDIYETDLDGATEFALVVPPTREALETVDALEWLQCVEQENQRPVARVIAGRTTRWESTPATHASDRTSLFFEDALASPVERVRATKGP